MNSNLYNDYQQIQKSHSDLCPHKIAALLQVSEAQLVHCRVGNEKVLRLSGKPADILQNLVSIGQAKGITRNTMPSVFKPVSIVTRGLVTMAGYF